MKNRIYAGIFYVICMVIFSGCPATLAFGRYQTVEFSTEPSGASIYDEDGFNIGITPVKIPLKRKRVQQLTIKKDGYHSAEIVMKRTINEKALPVFLLPLASPDALIYNICDIVGGGVFKKRQPIRHLTLQRLEADSTSSRSTTIQNNVGESAN
ncbi:MAG: hypothetical protein CME13_15970 [Gemmatimonadetes bacterium]|nr:hypothetical protein [Gemmatimonadota bacterium]